MLDRLPAWARHAILLLIPVLAAGLLPVAQAVTSSAGGLRAVAWSDAGWAGLDAAGLALAALVVLWATPLTRQYGRGAIPGGGGPLPAPTDVDPADPAGDVDPVEDDAEVVERGRE